MGRLGKKFIDLTQTTIKNLLLNDSVQYIKILSNQISIYLLIEKCNFVFVVILVWLQYYNFANFE